MKGNIARLLGEHDTFTTGDLKLTQDMAAEYFDDFVELYKDSCVGAI